VLDIGAHCGLYSAIAKSIVGEKGYVLAIEPNAALAPSFSANVGIAKPLSDIDALQGTGSEWLAVAAMDEPGTVYLSGASEEKSAYREVFKESAETSVPVQGVRIDDIDARLDRRFDLIKVDVEGVEDLVLAKQTRPVMAARHRSWLKRFARPDWDCITTTKCQASWCRWQRMQALNTPTYSFAVIQTQ